ncbi:hypothetical protein ILUMI_22290 [Ignelater luminosus]|uniref:Uncharacterized protein n=1 Tax=Ignelater luminosus TaxID=2038154 RepID=A0A8K0FXH0_IGNLU|nr:hypothetical protein ILUMI_22290 [Ignelater luminosus]
MSDLSGLITNKSAIELACRLPENTQEKVIALATEAAINDVQSGDVNKVKRYSESLKLNIEQLLDLIGLYISVIRVFMESDAKQFRETMTAVGFNEEFIENFPLKHKNNPRPKCTSPTKNYC